MRLRRIHGDLSLAIPHGFLSVFLSCLEKITRVAKEAQVSQVARMY